jgi:two-component sensor histidine kinase
VRNLVVNELGGAIEMESDGGTLVEVRVPVVQPPRMEA